MNWNKVSGSLSSSLSGSARVGCFQAGRLQQKEALSSAEFMAARRRHLHGGLVHGVGAHAAWVAALQPSAHMPLIDWIMHDCIASPGNAGTPLRLLEAPGAVDALWTCCQAQARMKAMLGYYKRRAW